MSLEAWGDEGIGDPDGYVTDDRAEEMFVAGARAMREMLARFVEQGGDATTAMSIRANWNPSWGDDPGRPASVQANAWTDIEDAAFRFDKTYCSQCGRELGPGNSGFSHCQDHQKS